MTLKLYDVQTITKIETKAIQEWGVPAFELMQRAGRVAFEVIREQWSLAKKFAVICGSGNNAGDGYVLAKLLLEDDFKVDVYSVLDPSSALSGVAELARQEFLSTGNSIKVLPNRLEAVDVIVDALLGIGFIPPLRTEWQKAIQLMNRSEKPIFSLDIPSGLDPNTGAVSKETVKASVTLSYIGHKHILLSGPAVNYAGQVVVNDLGLADILESIPWDGEIIDFPKTLSFLEHRKKSSHKGDYGHVLVIGAGKAGFSGAVGLAGSSALHAGAGAVSVFVHPEALSLLSRVPLELMCYSKEEEVPWQKANVCVLGPGLTESPWAKTHFDKALRMHKPMVVDADALNLLAQYPHKREEWVLTPHPGEAARLLGITVEQVEQNRRDAVKSLQARFGGVVVLKGAGTLVQGAREDFHLCGAGNPGMAASGMGDILAGLIGGLMAQGMPLYESALLGVQVHASAGDIEQSLGERGMMASDLLLHIRSLLNPTTQKIESNVSKFFNI
ncbi:MAG TPA: NAD(P)H-hydrate dehydratase [Gammaproteobacteria bacterium]|nr:NAD(P)H-hydrate dehydratase [Gammaproteobacteria bacterium]